MTSSLGEENIPKFEILRTLRHLKDMDSHHQSGQLGAGFGALAGLRLIVVDDEPGVLRALTLLLEALKCTVTPFSHPDGALEALRGHVEADMILCDLRMPGRSGLDVLRELKRQECPMPFVLMSGHAADPDIDEAHALGASAFISKPFSPAQLAQVVTRIFGDVRAYRQP